MSITSAAPDWRRVHAFGLPGGSIRGLLALAMFGAVWAHLAHVPERRLPEYLQNLMFIILGHYFAARNKPPDPVPGPNPLYLPRGVLRVCFVAGFVAIAALLAHQGHARLDDPDALAPGLLTLILVAGFLLGVVSTRLVGLWTRGGRRLPRAVEDLRAVVSLAAAVVLILMVFDVWEPPFRVQRFLVEDVLAAVVGFYFGSRS